MSNWVNLHKSATRPLQCCKVHGTYIAMCMQQAHPYAVCLLLFHIVHLLYNGVFVVKCDVKAFLYLKIASKYTYTCLSQWLSAFQSFRCPAHRFVYSVPSTDSINVLLPVPFRLFSLPMAHCLSIAFLTWSYTFCPFQQLSLIRQYNAYDSFSITSMTRSLAHLLIDSFTVSSVTFHWPIHWLILSPIDSPALQLPLFLILCPVHCSVLCPIKCIHFLISHSN
jgi:hypothetical protein